MGPIEGIGGAVVSLLKKAFVVVLLFIAIGVLVNWARNNPAKAQVTGDKVMNAAASVVGWGADGVTSMTGGSAAEAAGSGGVEVVMVQNRAPNRWHVGAAMRAWNAGLSTVQLRAGDCVSGLRCIKVTQVSDLPAEDGRLVLGRTNTLFGLSVRFNGAAAGHVSPGWLPVAACHELGHALGAEHRTVKSSCMDAVIGAGVSARPDAADFATVNAKFGH